MKFATVVLFATLMVVLMLVNESEAGGHKKGASGTACIVKGSYCSCHYCKCEKGWVHCGKKHGYGKKDKHLIKLSFHGISKNFYILNFYTYLHLYQFICSIYEKGEVSKC